MSDVLYINKQSFIVSSAVTEAEQMRGLMFAIPPFEPMIFVYAQPKINKFWMQNVIAPLDIVFCLNNKISNVCHGQPNSTSLIGNDELSDLVIELPYGTCEKMGIKKGDDVYVNLSKNTMIKVFSQKL